MKVQCPECEARFKLPDDQVRSGMKVRCSRCKHVFRLGSTTARTPKVDVLDATLGPASAESAVGAAFGSLDEIFSDDGQPAAVSEAAPLPPSAPRPTFGADDPFAMDDPFEATRGPFDIPGMDDDEDDLSLRAHQAARDGHLDDMIGGLLGSPGDFGGPDPGGYSPGPAAPQANHYAGMLEDDGPSLPPGLADVDSMDVQAGFGGLDEDPEGGGDDLAAYLAQSQQEAQSPQALGRIGLLPKGVKKGLVVEERLGGAPPPDEPPNAFELEGNEPPQPPTAGSETLGNLDRANQFAMDMDTGDDLGGGHFFDPDAGPSGSAEPTSQASEEPKKVPAARRRSPGRRSPPGVGAPVIAAGPAVSSMVVDANRSVPQTIANVMLISMMVGAAFLVFVAVQHDGLLDLYQLGDMTASAFGRGAYQGRAGGPTSAAPEIDDTVEVEEVEQMYFPNKNGEQLYVIEGKVVNRGDKTLKSVYVGGSVYNSRGDVIGSVTAPAGRAVSEEELLEIVDRKALAEVSKRIAKDTKDVRLGPKQAAHFSVVFPSLPGGVAQKRSFKVAVDSYLDSDAPEPKDKGGDDDEGAEDGDDKGKDEGKDEDEGKEDG